MTFKNGGWTKSSPAFLSNRTRTFTSITRAVLTIVTLLSILSANPRQSSANDVIPYDWTQTQFTPEPKELKPHRDKVYYTHLHFLLSERTKAIRNCAWLGTETSMVPRQVGIKARDFANTLKPLLVAPSAPEQKDIIKIIEALKSSLKMKTDDTCKTSIEFNEKELFDRERSKFTKMARTGKRLCKVAQIGCSMLSDCGDFIDVLMELDPYCRAAEVVLPEFGGYQESTPCFAGDFKVFQSVYSNPVFNSETVRSKIKTYMERFFDATLAAKEGDSLDLWSFFDYDYSADYIAQREFFMGLITMFYAAAKSELGYVDGFGDLLTKRLLYIENKTPEDVYNAYTEFKQSVDLFRAIKEWALKRNLMLVIMKLDSKPLITLPKDVNHHDLMAAYLACTMRPKHGRDVSQLIPEVMGMGYEAMDYVGHRKEGMSHEKSMDNFKHDTQRYVDGAKWGYDFCLPL